MESESDFEFLRGFLNSLSGTDVQGLSTQPTREVLVLYLLLSWAGLLAQRQLLARAALQRDSSAQEQLLCTAQQGWGIACSRPGTAQRHREMRGSVQAENAARSLLESPAQSLAQ